MHLKYHNKLVWKCPNFYSISICESDSHRFISFYMSPFPSFNKSSHYQLSFIHVSQNTSSLFQTVACSLALSVPRNVFIFFREMSSFQHKFFLFCFWTHTYFFRKRNFINWWVKGNPSNPRNTHVKIFNKIPQKYWRKGTFSHRNEEHTCSCSAKI
jgi:hypothetical protein